MKTMLKRVALVSLLGVAVLGISACHGGDGDKGNNIDHNQTN